MARVNLLGFKGDKHKGLWVMGPREKTPETHLRRLTGVHSLRERELRSRNGTTVDATIAGAHSLTRFDDVRFQGATTVLYKAGVSISTGFDGTPLEFDVSEPKSGTAAEYLFVSGGGKLEKVDTAGTVTQWGIDPPDAGDWGVTVGGSGTGESDSEVTVGTAQTKVLVPTDGSFVGGSLLEETFDGLVATTFVDTVGVDSATGSAICGTFPQSVQISSLSPGVQGRIHFFTISPLDLTTHTGGDASPAEDFFTFFAKGDFRGKAEMSVRLQTGVGSTKDFAFFRIQAQSKAQPVSTLGLASILEVQNSQTDLLGRDRFAGVTDQDKLSMGVAEKTWVIPINEWQFFTIPKRLFAVNNGFSFGTVHDIKITFTDVSGISTVCVSDIFLVGGGVDHSGAPSTAQGTTDTASSGLQGTYKYRLTFKNSVTGNRSNPSPATQVASNVNRAGVTLTSIPVSADAQVDLVEIWRTVGNGSDFFKIAEIANGVTSFLDEVADHDSLDSTEGVAVMTDEALQFDNDVPDSDLDQHVIVKLRAFWISNGTGKEGRLFFSPTGRPEAQDGFIEVSKVGDPLHRLVVFNGILYVLSESRVYRIDEDSAGFLYSKEIGGVPGVQFAQRRTVIPTPRGVFWQATDGIRSFDGTRSILVNPDPIQKVFRGETAEGIPAFEGTTATFARGEYLVSNGSRLLAVSLADVSWRDVGFNDVTALYYEYDTDKVVAGRVANTQLVEEEGVFTDAAAAIPIEWETPALDGPNDSVVIVERVFNDMDPNSNSITPLLINRFDSVSLTVQTGAGRRTFEDDVQLMVLKPSVRITGNVTSRVTVFDIELEVRNLVLGINIEGGTRVEVTGRYREDVGSGQLVFEVKPDQAATAALDQVGRLFIIDRLAVEANTDSTTVTPSLIMHGSTITLAGISNAARGFTEFEIDRVGQLEEVRLAGDFTVSGTRPQVYRVEVYLRELQLGVNVTSGQQRLAIGGRAVDPSTGATFEMQPIKQELNQLGSLLWVERVVVEADTDSNDLTLTYTDGLGNAIALGTVNNATREYTEFSIERPGPVRALNITTDLTADIQIFGIEMFVRPVLLTVQDRTSNQVVRTKHDGKMIAQDTVIVFDIDPYRNETDGDTYIPLVDQLIIDMNSNGVSVTPKIVTELGNFVLTSFSTTLRETTIFDISRVGNIQRVELAGDFTTGMALFDLQLLIRPLDLGINIITNAN
jgi:hypothetical protein